MSDFLFFLCVFAVISLTFLFFDIFRNKITAGTLAFWIRIIVVAGTAVLFGTDIFCIGRPGVREAAVNISMAACVAAMIPCVNERGWPSFVMIGLGMAAALIISAFLKCHKTAGVCLTEIVCVIVDAVVKARTRPSWEQACLPLVLCVLISMMGIAPEMGTRCTRLMYIAAAVGSLSFFSLHCAGRITGWTFKLNREKGRGIGSPMTGEMHQMGSLYKDIIAYMDDKKPYLDDDFSLKDFSTRLYTNQTYISRTVNKCSGRNFRQFVNGYRVKYAVELFKQNPNMSVQDMCVGSGFHSPSSFCSAFNAYMNENPSDWVRHYRAELTRRGSSRTKEQEP